MLFVLGYCYIHVKWTVVVVARQGSVAYHETTALTVTAVETSNLKLP